MVTSALTICAFHVYHSRAIILRNGTRFLWHARTMLYVDESRLKITECCHETNGEMCEATDLHVSRFSAFFLRFVELRNDILSNLRHYIRFYLLLFASSGHTREVAQLSNCSESKVFWNRYSKICLKTKSRDTCELRARNFVKRQR